MPRSFRGILRHAALTLAALTVAVCWGRTAPAQIADATVEVTVLDESGLPLPGTTVELRRAETGFARVGVTGEKGTARMPAIPAAGYQLKASLSGFQPVEQQLVLRVGQTAKLKLTLRTVGVTEVVVVTGTVPLVDVYKTDSSTNVVPEQIKELPVLNRNFEQLAFVAPGVERERGEFRFATGGPVIGAGGNASQSTILVDGVDYTDPALGLAKTRISQDTIAEFRVVNNRFDAEVGGSSGGALSVVTKTGTNDFKGSVFGFYRADFLRARKVVATESTDLNRVQGGLAVGGPIVKDQTHVFVSLEQLADSETTLVRPGGSVYCKGCPDDRSVDASYPTHQLLFFLGVDHRLSESMNLTARADYQRSRQDNFRVGGTGDVAQGLELNRDNVNLTLADTWVLGGSTTNELRGQIGQRKYEEPANSNAMGDWFSSGNTYRTGGSIYGGMKGNGNQWELRDTLYAHLSGKTGTHDLKLGAGFMRVNEQYLFDLYPTGIMLWLGDTKVGPLAPLAYLYGVGSSQISLGTNRFSAFVQDDWRPFSTLTVSLGVRYDLDTNGNNADFTHPLVPEARGSDKNNVQPRGGFSWDLLGNGNHVVRGGAGLFTGRYLLVAAFTELQQNGVTGRRLLTRYNGAIFGLPQALWLDPNNPQTTGWLQSPDITLLDKKLDAPESTQYSLGWTAKLWQTGLFLDTEGIYVKGRNEIVVRDVNWNGNANPTRPIAGYRQVNTYTNQGRSEYKALTFALNGTLKGGHLLTASATFASKRNVNDDFSPDILSGYPSDPANIDAEYGRARSTERYRFVLSGVFRLPWRFSVAPIYEYGAGMPWSSRLGYDANGDGKTGDRAAGVERNGMDGPPYRSLNLRITKAFDLGGTFGLELIAEGFNLFNTINWNVDSVDNAQFLRAPTATASYPNPNYGKYNDTLDARAIQFGARLTF